MNKLQKVADGILDEAISEYIEFNTQSIESVVQYANGCDISLTNEEAEKVLNTCKEWLKIKGITCEGQNDYYFTVIQPLETDLKTQIDLAMNVKNNLISQLKNRIQKDKANDFANVKDEMDKDELLQEIYDKLKWDAHVLEIAIPGISDNYISSNEINDICNDYADEAIDLIEAAIKSL